MKQEYTIICALLDNRISHITAILQYTNKIKNAELKIAPVMMSINETFSPKLLMHHQRIHPK